MREKVYAVPSSLAGKWMGVGNFVGRIPPSGPSIPCGKGGGSASVRLFCHLFPRLRLFLTGRAEFGWLGGYGGRTRMGIDGGRGFDFPHAVVSSIVRLLGVWTDCGPFSA